ncbi:MAG: hypothetical protein K6C08_08300, partial [Oscillospiraceae bacterium]|nr:hypothetical protein [Oscillospiraceae bacterium]
MKNNRKSVVFLLLATLISLSLMGFTAYAEGSTVQIPSGAMLDVSETVNASEWSSDAFFVEESNSDGMTAEGSEPDAVFVDTGSEWVDYETPSCSFRKVIRSDWGEQTEDIFFPAALSSLMDKNVELLIMPPEGFYISSLSLGYGAWEPLRSIAVPGSQEVRISFSDLLKADGSGFDGDFVGSPDGNTFFLNITCDEMQEGYSPSVSYSSGSLGYDGSLAGYWGSMQVPALPDDVASYAASNGYEFAGYVLKYDNGASMEVSAWDTLSLYMNAVVEVQWRQVEVPQMDQQADGQVGDQYVPDIPETEIITEQVGEQQLSQPAAAAEVSSPSWELPTLTLRPTYAEKVYDGTPLLPSGVDIVGETYGYSVSVTAMDGSITEPGSAVSSI